ncbi:MAG: PEP-CTERM sorting domain-containing protein [Kamptonema sp. SIO4C4]|nr:PEP-CTERM sorting domain-containing protein [Kamptonema sp. SIO4C4]
MNTIYNFVKTSCLSAGVALSAVALTLAPAEAFSLRFSEDIGSTESTGSSALADFDFVQDGNNVVLNLTMTNTTDVGVEYSTLVGLGWQNPDGSYDTSLDSNGTDFTQLYDPATLQPYGNFDLGIRADGGGNFSGGNPDGGLGIGESATVKVSYSLEDGSFLDATNLEQMFSDMYQSAGSDGQLASGDYSAVARFQQVGTDQEGSDKVLGAYFMEDDPAADVPEPGTILALGSVVVGAAGLRRKNR